MESKQEYLDDLFAALMTGVDPEIKQNEKDSKDDDGNSQELEGNFRQPNHGVQGWGPDVNMVYDSNLPNYARE